MVLKLDLLEMIYSSADDALKSIQDQRCDISIQVCLLMVVLHHEDAVHWNPGISTELFHLVITHWYKKL